MKVAHLISFIFHPLFAPIFSLSLILNLPFYLNYKFSEDFFLYIYVIILMNLIVAPLLISLYLKRIKLIKSLFIDDVQERVIPYLIYSIFYAFTYFLLSKVGFPILYLQIFGAAGVAIAVLFVFSLFKLKVSAHLAGIGGICGMLIVLSLQLTMDLSSWLMLFIFISGVVGAARLKLSVHTLWEVVGGFVLGIGSQMILLF